EGTEKIVEFIFHRSKKGHEVVEEAKKSDDQTEKVKIKSAITTDFILSVEIVIIALGTVIGRSLPIQILTVSVVALLATVGVYGLVALIVRMDDIGFNLIKHSNDKGVRAKLGQILVKSLPVIIKILGIVGTIALLLVSGGIFVHNIEYLHHFLDELPMVVKELLIGFACGIVVLIVVKGFKIVRAAVRRQS
ncbi:MAG TPA: DUF808 family protein, partial [Chryseosolibacter sp.]